MFIHLYNNYFFVYSCIYTGTDWELEVHTLSHYRCAQLVWRRKAEKMWTPWSQYGTATQKKNGLEKTHVPSTHCRVLFWTNDFKRIWGKWLFSNTLVSYLYTHSNVHTRVHVGTPDTNFSFIFRTTGGVPFCPAEILLKEPAFSLCVHGCKNTTNYPWPQWKCRSSASINHYWYVENNILWVTTKDLMTIDLSSSSWESNVNILL